MYSSSRLLAGLAFCAILVPSVLSAQQKITTNFVSNNGGGANWGNLFDINVTGPNSISIFQIDVNSRATTANLVHTIDVYLTSGTYVGKDAKAVAWVKVGTGTGSTSGVRNTPTIIKLKDPITLNKGKYGVWVHNPGLFGVWYTNGNTTNQTVKNADMTITLGIAKTALFGGSTFNPRVWNGTIHYFKKTTASYGTFGVGCKGSSGVPTLTPKTGSIPKLGSVLQLDLTNLPTKNPSFAVMFTGFTNNSFSSAPLLPLDLTPLGAKGCQLLTDLTILTPLTIIGGKTTFTMPVPNLAFLSGFAIYQQALVLDPPANTAGFTMTNGGDGRLGN